MKSPTDRYYLLALLVITVALFRKALFGGDVILSHPAFLDLTHHIYPWRLFSFGLLKQGIVPLWNPYLFCGAPFVANWHSGIFYPLNLIFLFMPTHTALNWSIAFHFFLTGAFMYAFVKYLLVPPPSLCTMHTPLNPVPCPELSGLLEGTFKESRPVPRLQTGVERSGPEHKPRELGVCNPLLRGVPGAKAERGVCNPTSQSKSRKKNNTRLPAFIAALAFIFSGPYLVQLFPGHIFNPLPWLPLSFLLFEMALRKKRMIFFLLGGVVLALQILAGHPQYMLYCLGGLILFSLYRAGSDCRRERSFSPLKFTAAGFVILIATGIGLSTIQSFPSMEFAKLSSRAMLSGPETVSEVSFPPENLMTLLAPGFFGDMHAVRYWGRWLLWETNLYLGILPLILAFVGVVLVKNRYTRFFAGLAILSLILAFGKYSPLFELLYHYVPGFNLFRAQAKFIFLAVFSLAVLAGYGCHRVIAGLSGKGKALRRICAAAAAFSLLLLALCAVASATGGHESPLWHFVLRCREAAGFEGTPPLHLSEGPLIPLAFGVACRSLITAAVLLAVSVILIILAARKKLRPSRLGALIVAVTLFDLWHFGARYIITSPLESCSWPHELVSSLSGLKANYRILAPNIGTPGANQNINEGIHAIGGYQTNNVGLYKEYVDYSQGTTPKTQLTFAVEEPTPMLEALGLRYLLLPATQSLDRNGYTLRYRNGRTAVYERKDFIPRARIVHHARVIPDKAEVLAELRNPAFDHRNEVILSEPPGITLTAAEQSADSHATITRSEPHEVIINATLSAPGILVLTDTYYPGWKAYVNGKERPLLRANHAFRAVALQIGHSLVRFEYQPHLFTRGIRLSLLSLAVVLISLTLPLLTRPQRFLV